MQTLLLDTVEWDLVLDVNGNIAVASNPYSLAQDAASACKLFLGELWYDTRQGIPYFETILGKSPPLSYLKTKLEDAAKTVPDVVDAVAYITSIVGRKVSGQIQVTDTEGVITAANF